MIEATKMGNAPSMIESIVVKKMAKRCHALTLKPSGTGRNQIIVPIRMVVMSVKFLLKIYNHL